MRLIFGVMPNNCIWRYFNLAKFKVLLYNLKSAVYVIGGILIWSYQKIAKSPNFNPSQNFYSYGNYIAMHVRISAKL